MYIPGLLFCVCVFVYIIRSLIRRTRDDLQRIPGPSTGIANWIWGHELLIFEHEATQMYTIWAKISGPVFKIKAALFHPDIMIVADHAAAQHIFAHPYSYVKSPAFRPMIANLMGRGVVWAEGDDHKMQRRILAPVFSPENVRGMANDISECAETLQRNLTSHVLAHGGSVSVNIVEYCSSATLDIIGRIGFGHTFKTGAEEPAGDAAAIAAAWAHHVNMGLTFTAFVAPIVGATKLVMRRLAGRLMEAAAMDGSVALGNDILSSLMRARKESDAVEGLTDEQILDNISTFTMVGHETTAAVLSFTLLALAQHPDAQQKLRDEVLPHTQDFRCDELERLSYLDAVVKEGVSQATSISFGAEDGTSCDIIPLSKPIGVKNGQTMHTIRINKGQVFHIPFTTMNTNPSAWGPDAASFAPERWLKPGGVPRPSELPHGWSGLATFCDGPRNCIGYRLALLEMKVRLARVVSSLEFHATDTVAQQKISPTLQPLTDGRGGVLPLYVTIASRA